ncbi:hypothetical protein [Halomicrococcus sp. NG-SE-24]|uniref:hypothetical protein n=1 Tax=Halomicrococcus sp. NG-SE-24 TaxID=3436928 RepID=UPI003D95CBFA
MTTLVRKYEYVGLAVLLSVPLMPDTAVIYTFSILNADNERLLILAAFLGTVDLDSVANGVFETEVDANVTGTYRFHVQAVVLVGS